jgi:hypothetical protein
MERVFFHILEIISVAFARSDLGGLGHVSGDMLE